MSDLPITATVVEGVPIYDAMNTLNMRQSWLTGTAEEGGKVVEFELDSGAGLGSPMLQLSIQAPGEGMTRELIDVRDLLRWWLPGHVERRNSNQVSVFGSARAQSRERTDTRPTNPKES